MRGIEYCYYHRRVHLGPRLLYPTLTMLEDAHGVQAALMEVLCGILDGALTDKQAAMLLYGLQTAASNLEQSGQSDLAQQATGLIEQLRSNPEGAKAAIVSFVQTNPQVLEHFAPDFAQGILSKLGI